MLPFLEQPALHAAALAAYQLDPWPFHHPPHTHINTVVPIFVCPSAPGAGDPQLAARSQYEVAFTCYLGVSGRDWSTKDGMLFQDSRTRLADATDGTSNTLLVGERPPSADWQFGWWYAGAGQLHRLGGHHPGRGEANLLPVTTGSCRRATTPSWRAAPPISAACSTSGACTPAGPTS